MKRIVLVLLLFLISGCKIIVTLEGRLEHDLRQHLSESDLRVNFIKSNLPRNIFYVAYAESADKKYEKEKLTFKLWSKRKYRIKHTLKAGMKIGTSKINYLIGLKPYCQKDYCPKKNNPYCILILRSGKKTLKLKITCRFNETVRLFYFKHFGYFHGDKKFFYLGKKGKKTLLQVGRFYQKCYIVKIQPPLWITKKDCYLDLECQDGKEKLILLSQKHHSSCTL